MDGTGVPVVKKETVGRQGKKDDQRAHTREAKVGRALTQTTTDRDGYPIRDPDSTTYVAAIESAEEFGKRIYVEAWNRRWGRTEKKVVIGDGAQWIWNLANEHFRGAVQIVDLYPARQHLWDLARKLHQNGEARHKAWMKVDQKRLLDKRKSKSRWTPFPPRLSSNPAAAETIRIGADYFATNAERMRYPKFRRQHLVVGSGVIECKTVVGSRLKGVRDGLDEGFHFDRK
jgi:hypothetical protein